MSDNRWVIGATIKAREQELRSLFARRYLLENVRRARRLRPGPRVAPACACAQPCC